MVDFWRHLALLCYWAQYIDCGVM